MVRGWEGNQKWFWLGRVSWEASVVLVAQSWAGVWDHHCSVRRSLNPQSLGMVLLCGIWGCFACVKLFFGCGRHKEAAVIHEGWWADSQQTVKLSPALGAAALEMGNCCKFSRWARYQIQFPCERRFLLILDLNVLCWEDHSPELSPSSGNMSSQPTTAVDWEGPHATCPNIPVSQSRPQHQQG